MGQNTRVAVGPMRRNNGRRRHRVADAVPGQGSARQTRTFIIAALANEPGQEVSAADFWRGARCPFRNEVWRLPVLRNG